MDKTLDTGYNYSSASASHQKTLTPAVLGMPCGSHGAKLPLNMNSKDKEQFFLKLEEWRQARREKLTATILAKGKTSCSSKVTSAVPKAKLTLPNTPIRTDAKDKQYELKKSVFDRLYENASKTGVKKTEEQKNKKLTVPKNLQISQTYHHLPAKKPKVPKVILMVDSDGSSDKTLKGPDVKHISEEQNNVEVEDEAHNTGSVSMHVSQETNSFELVEKNVSNNRNEVDDKVDGLGNDDQAGNFDIKKSVSFETPREKILSGIHLRNKLEDWLTTKGHSIDGFRHLNCFGLNVEKTPVPYHRQTKTDDFSNSSFYSTAPNTPIIDESNKENVTPQVSASNIDIREVEGWLSDLHRLIVHVNYPNERCEEWLNAITKKFPNCTDLPIYWECLAAMNGNSNILKAAEESENPEKEERGNGENTLAELLDKLAIDERCHSASKLERGLSVSNIFKSKTVKFALHEKAVNELDPESGKKSRRKVLVATPVRRSARLQTPEKSNVVVSLQSLDSEVRSNVSFQPNGALLTR